MGLELHRFFAIAASCFFSAIATILFIPWIRKVGEKLRIIDKPDERKQHRTPLVHIGGLGMAAGTLITLIIAWYFNNLNFNYAGNPSLLLLVFISSLIYCLIGLTDDLFGLSPWSRLTTQFLIATCLWFCGFHLRVIDISLIFSETTLIQIPILIDYFITVIWIVGVTNAINWMDGLDGLAAGISLMLFAGITLISLNNDFIYISLFASALSGSCLGFIKYNRFPAEIYMGDGGSYFLGFNLATLSILASSNIIKDNAGNEILIVSIIIPFILLSLPIIDMINVISSRIRSKKSPFFPDRNHLHHRLIKRGYSHLNSVRIIYILTQYCIGLALLYMGGITGKIIFSITTSIAILFLFHIKNNRGNNI